MKWAKKVGQGVYRLSEPVFAGSCPMTGRRGRDLWFLAIDSVHTWSGEPITYGSTSRESALHYLEIRGVTSEVAVLDRLGYRLSEAER